MLMVWQTPNYAASPSAQSRAVAAIAIAELSWLDPTWVAGCFYVSIDWLFVSIDSANSASG
jgi:hypothetical protein